MQTHCTEYRYVCHQPPEYVDVPLPYDDEMYLQSTKFRVGSSEYGVQSMESRVRSLDYY